jgi:hypothetical protein
MKKYCFPLSVSSQIGHSHELYFFNLFWSFLTILGHQTPQKSAFSYIFISYGNFEKPEHLITFYKLVIFQKKVNQ